MCCPTGSCDTDWVGDSIAHATGRFTEGESETGQGCDDTTGEREGGISLCQLSTQKSTYTLPAPTDNSTHPQATSAEHNGGTLDNATTKRMQQETVIYYDW